MDLRDIMEIYIPVEAEVKTIPLWSLPNSVSRRMGLLMSNSNCSKELKNCAVCIWISPAVIRRKGQKQAAHTENEVKEDMVSLLGRKTQSGSGSLRMSFVTSNRTAYRVLMDTMPGKTVAAPSQLRQGSSPQTCRDAVVIYNSQIYLSIRKPNRSQNQREAREPQPASQSCAPSTSDSSSKSQKKDLLNDNKPKKKCITREVKHSENKNGVTQTVRDVSSMSARSAPHRVDAHRHEEPDWFQPQEELMSNDGGECEMQDLDSEEAESIDHKEPEGAACASTSLQIEFEDLEQEEMIARMKAKLREREAALSSLNSS